MLVVYTLSMCLNLRQIIHLAVLGVFWMNTLGPVPLAQADDFHLPAPGAMVQLSPLRNPPILKGLKVHPDNPFRFDFILDRGYKNNHHSERSEESQSFLKQESTRLIKYFLASLTIPEKDLWVNLSPYEKNRIIPQSFGMTEMGRDLLAEDYMLKQITASLIYPEGQTGKKFWTRVYQEAAQKFGTTDIPVNTFNKVWIVPDKAVVYENAKAGTAYVVEAKLKVMLEEDYLSMGKHASLKKGTVPLTLFNKGLSPFSVNTLGSQVLRTIVIPELNREVNSGANFAQLRQVYNSLILATWYKKKIKDSILAQVYADKNKITGVEPLVSLRGSAATEAISKRTTTDVEFIYQRYLQAFKKGVYNYIKEEPIDGVIASPQGEAIFKGTTILRKYFSGGVDAIHISAAMSTTSQLPQDNGDGAMRIVTDIVYPKDMVLRAMTNEELLGYFMALRGQGPKHNLPVPVTYLGRDGTVQNDELRMTQVLNILGKQLMLVRGREMIIDLSRSQRFGEARVIERAGAESFQIIWNSEDARDAWLDNHEMDNEDIETYLMSFRSMKFATVNEEMQDKVTIPVHHAATQEGEADSWDNLKIPVVLELLGKERVPRQNGTPEYIRDTDKSKLLDARVVRTGGLQRFQFNWKKRNRSSWLASTDEVFNQTCNLPGTKRVRLDIAKEFEIVQGDFKYEFVLSADDGLTMKKSVYNGSKYEVLEDTKTVKDFTIGQDFPVLDEDKRKSFTINISHGLAGRPNALAIRNNSYEDLKVRWQLFIARLPFAFEGDAYMQGQPGSFRKNDLQLVNAAHGTMAVLGGISQLQPDQIRKAVAMIRRDLMSLNLGHLETVKEVRSFMARSAGILEKRSAAYPSIRLAYVLVWQDPQGVGWFVGLNKGENRLYLQKASGQLEEQKGSKIRGIQTRIIVDRIRPGDQLIATTGLGSLLGFTDANHYQVSGGRVGFSSIASLKVMSNGHRSAAMASFQAPRASDKAMSRRARPRQEVKRDEGKFHINIDVPARLREIRNELIEFLDINFNRDFDTIFRTTLNGVSPVAVYDKQELSNIVWVHFADEDKEGYHFLLSIARRDGHPGINILLTAAKAEDYLKYHATEIRTLQRLRGRGALRSGGVLSFKKRLWIFQQSIEAENLGQVMLQEGGISHDRFRQLVSALRIINRSIGEIPEALQPSHFVIHQPIGEILLQTPGNRNLRPFGAIPDLDDQALFFGVLLYWYGQSTPEASTFIFDQMSTFVPGNFDDVLKQLYLYVKDGRKNFFDNRGKRGAQFISGLQKLPELQRAYIHTQGNLAGHPLNDFLVYYLQTMGLYLRHHLAAEALKRRPKIDYSVGPYYPAYFETESDPFTAYIDWLRENPEPESARIFVKTFNREFHNAVPADQLKNTDMMVFVPPRAEASKSVESLNLVLSNFYSELGPRKIQGDIHALYRPAEPREGEMFRVRPSVDVEGKRILLMEEIVETGEDTAAAKRALEKAGAKEVKILAIGNVPFHPQPAPGPARRSSAMTASPPANIELLATPVNELWDRLYDAFAEILSLKIRNENQMAVESEAGPSAVASLAERREPQREKRRLLVEYVVKTLGLKEKAEAWVGINADWERLRENLGVYPLDELNGETGIRFSRLRNFLGEKGDLNYEEVQRAEEFLVKRADSQANFLRSIGDLDRNLIAKTEELLAVGQKSKGWLAQQLDVSQKEVTEFLEGQKIPHGRFLEGLAVFLIQELSLTGKDRAKVEDVRIWDREFHALLTEALQRHLFSAIARAVGKQQAVLYEAHVDKSGMPEKELMPLVEEVIHFLGIEHQTNVELRGVSRWYGQLQQMLRQAKAKGLLAQIATDTHIPPRVLEDWTNDMPSPTRDQREDLEGELDRQLRITAAAGGIEALNSWYDLVHDQLRREVELKTPAEVLEELNKEGIDVSLSNLYRLIRKTDPQEPGPESRQQLADYLYSGIKAEEFGGTWHKQSVYIIPELLANHWPMPELDTYIASLPERIRPAARKKIETIAYEKEILSYARNFVGRFEGVFLERLIDRLKNGETVPELEHFMQRVPVRSRAETRAEIKRLVLTEKARAAVGSKAMTASPPADIELLATPVNELWDRLYDAFAEILKLKIRNAHQMAVESEAGGSAVARLAERKEPQREKRRLLAKYVANTLWLEEKLKAKPGIDAAWEDLRENLETYPPAELAQETGIELLRLNDFFHEWDDLEYDELVEVEKYLIPHSAARVRLLLSIPELNQNLISQTRRLLAEKREDNAWFAMQLNVPTKQISEYIKGLKVPPAKLAGKWADYLVSQMHLEGEPKTQMEDVKRWAFAFHQVLGYAARRNLLSGVARSIGMNPATLYSTYENWAGFSLEKLTPLLESLIKHLDLERGSERTLAAIKLSFEQSQMPPAAAGVEALNSWYELVHNQLRNEVELKTRGKVLQELHERGITVSAGTFSEWTREINPVEPGPDNRQAVAYYLYSEFKARELSGGAAHAHAEGKAMLAKQQSPLWNRRSSVDVLKTPLQQLYDRLYDKLNQAVEQWGSARIAAARLRLSEESIRRWQRRDGINRQDRRLLIRRLILKTRMIESQEDRLREVDFWYTALQRALSKVIEEYGQGGLTKVAGDLKIDPHRLRNWIYRQKSTGEPAEPDTIEEAQHVADYLLTLPPAYNPFRSSRAMAVPGNGGIDLTPARLHVETRDEGMSIRFHMDPAMLAHYQNAAGFEPVVRSIEPLGDLKSFLTT